MKINLKLPTSEIIRENFSNKWFIASVFITILLIILLVWSLVNSYQTLKKFGSENIVLERSVGEFLYYSKAQETAAQMAAATGNLRWQTIYNEEKGNLQEAMQQIKKVVDENQLPIPIGNIGQILSEIQEIEERSFALVGRGSNEQALDLLASWEYIKAMIELEESVGFLAEGIKNHIDSQIAQEGRLITLLLAIVFISLLILAISWTVSVKTWQINYGIIKRKEAEIAYLTYHDSLTGLHNRRFFEEAVRKLNTKEQMPLGLIIGDADGLKYVNDTYGHQKGDQMLMEIASILKGALRPADIICRWGGDEFAVLLPMTTEEEVKKIKNDMIKTLHNSDFQEIDVNVSMGYAVKEKESESIDKIFTIAETYMYEHKKDAKHSR